MKDLDLYKIGVLTKTHGVNGEFNFSFTDDTWDTDDADHLFVEVDGLPVPFYIEEYRFRGDTAAIIKFEDIDDEPTAREYAGCAVLYERSENTSSPDALIGMRVNDLGVITNIDDTTENILFTVRTDDGAEHLVPAAAELITDIDWERHTIHINIPEGLLEL